MNQEILSKSIALIGPSCVGKSLFAKELAKRLNLPLINIDELLDMIELEKYGHLDSTPQKQQEYINRCLMDISQDTELKETLTDPQYIETTHRLVHEFIDMFNYYHNLLGDFKPFYEIMNKYDYYYKNIHDPLEIICTLNYLTNEMLTKIFDVINQPIILDSPAPFGWQANNSLDFFSKLRLKRCTLNIDTPLVDNVMTETLSKMQTVLLLPGLDYKTRNAFSKVEPNNIILEDLDNYYTANIEITTNGLFNSPENKYFKQRGWFDAKEILTKEKLKDSGEINNICDEILARLEELKLGNQLTDDK